MKNDANSKKKSGSIVIPKAISYWDKKENEHHILLSIFYLYCAWSLNNGIAMEYLTMQVAYMNYIHKLYFNLVSVVYCHFFGQPDKENVMFTENMVILNSPNG